MYKNSGREKGTLRFFREKLNRRKVTVDIKHYEDCEQLFASVGKCFVIEALLEFFNMADTKGKPTANCPHTVFVLQEEYRRTYIIHILDKFMDVYLFDDAVVEDGGVEDGHVDNADEEQTDGVWCYAVNVLRCYLLRAYFKDAVANGNGEYLSILRKQ